MAPPDTTIAGGIRIRELLRGRNLSKVCAVDYVMDFDEWIRGFDHMLDTLTG